MFYFINKLIYAVLVMFVIAGVTALHAVLSGGNMCVCVCLCVCVCID